jgi:hypothetical protein
LQLGMIIIIVNVMKKYFMRIETCTDHQSFYFELIFSAFTHQFSLV